MPPGPKAERPLRLPAAKSPPGQEQTVRRAGTPLPMAIPVAFALALAAAPPRAAAQQPTAESRTRTTAGAAGAAAARPALPAEEWDVTKARGQTRDIDFTTSEGTWLSVDLSPDGRTLLFDLLGHIWRLPATGGEAVALTENSGVATNYHPRWSPDGRLIAFVSDRKGQNNLWIMNADGSDPRPVFLDRDVRVRTPVWTPDGQYIIVRRDWVGAGSSEGKSGLWMYHRDGGSGVPLVTKGDVEWPTVSPDGRYVYFQLRSGGSDALTGDYQIQRLELESGEIIDITAGNSHGVAASRATSGGAFAPEVSPDGHWLAFGRQIGDGLISFKGHTYGPRTALWLRNLDTGEERLAMDPISVAIESGAKSLRILPGYGWSRDGKSIVIAEGGKVRRLDVATGRVATIPFTAHVHRTISEMAYAPFRISDGAFEAKYLRWHTLSPDGRRLAFQAVGRVWVMDLPDGTPRRVTPRSFDPLEYGPTWSPDGRWLAFTSHDDRGLGYVWKVPPAGGAPVRVTADSGEYVHPAWSRDGREIAVARGSGATLRGRTLTHDPWWDVVRVPATGGRATLVARVALPAGTNPTSVARRAILTPSYGPDGRIFFPVFQRDEKAREMKTALVSVKPDGGDRRVHVILPYADEATPSPDGRWLAFQEGDNVYLTALPYEGTGAAPIELDKRHGRLPVRQLSLEGGMFPHWHDSLTVEFGSANRHVTYHVATEKAETTTVRLMVPRGSVAPGTIALTGARIVSLGNPEVIEKGTIVVKDGRITCVGTCSTAGADRVLDETGKTIIPGFVDMHSHHYREWRGYRPRHDYEVSIYLAYGVTTDLDPSMWSQNIFPSAELIESGEMIGPRTFSTGDPLYKGDAARNNDLSSYAATEHDIAKLQSWGAVSMKQYLQPRRDQRQWVSDVARKRGLMVTAEGGDLFYNLGMIMDGQTGWEHPLSYVPLYSDVTKFFGLAHATYSPTLVVAGPGPWNIEYFFGASNVWKDPKQRRWMPWRMDMGHLRRRTLRPETDYSFPLLAQGLADIIAEGGHGALGSHGEHHGTNAQWEVWMEASALGPLGALRVASLDGAHFLGVDRDVGSLEVGKLGDLIVLDANPLEDIHNTADMQYVMKGGVLYDADTLDEVWPQKKPYGPYYWNDADAQRQDTRPMDYWDRH